ncbi:MAG: histidine kinase [Betaproteobacteria bacterium HGW-Betaproteobacteria-10]|nr:MAG: histidine kinase [Betaproteobacteria bacterium HGW-Betaproteobacteria-10]
MTNWRLMVVDDDRMTVALLSAALADVGTVDVAVNGNQALISLETEALPDLILLDAWMPGLNGFEVCAALKANPRLASIPVIFVTGSSDHESEIRALQAGAVDFIAKPLNLPTVQARVRTQLTLLEQKRALESRLAEQSAKIEGLLNAIPDPVWLKNAVGVYVTVNPAALQFFERAEADVLNHTARDLFSPEVAARSEAADHEVLASGKPGIYELETRSPSTGRRYFWEVIRTPIAADSSAPPGVLSIARDVTARKETENQLRMLSLAVEKSPNAIIITDATSHIEYVNAAFCRVSGYAASEVIGRRAGFMRSGKTPAATFAEMWRALGQGHSWRGRFSNLRQDGREVVNLAHISPIFNDDGKLIHYLSLQEDITEREQLAEEIHDARAAIALAEAANQAKSGFLANMSHEIRTPMNAIIGLTHLLRQEQTTPRQDARLGQISVAAEHLLGIVNDILDISKIEAGRMELAPTDFRLADVMAQVSAQVAERMRAKEIRYFTDVSALPPFLHGDALRLTQILLNYLGNAIKFTAAGSIKLTGTVLEETDSAVFVRFSVEDTGIGISPKVLPRLFQAFEQADKSTTRKFGGTGLGLRINRHFAQLMGGDVGVESTPGVGSRFWATLRLAKSSQTNLQEITRPPQLNQLIARLQASSGIKLLLAEDNPINQEVALAVLSNVGIAADLANNGAEAVAAARARAYDLILMDMQMPELDGLAATQAIRRLAGYALTPIIAMTANAFEEDRKACLAAGMNDHVAKPASPETLYAVLLKWLNRSEAVASAAQPLTADLPAVLPSLAFDKSANTSIAAAPDASLATVPGLDYTMGLKQMSGNLGVYEKLLRQFAVGVAKDLAALAQCLADNQPDKARKIAHGVKGSAGVLGATRVHELAAALENSMRGAAEFSLIARQLEALGVETRRLTEGIASIDLPIGKKSPTTQ